MAKGILLGEIGRRDVLRAGLIGLGAIGLGLARVRLTKQPPRRQQVLDLASWSWSNSPAPMTA